VITAVLIRNDDNIQLQEDTQCGDHNIIPFLVVLMRLLLVLCNHPIVDFSSSSYPYHDTAFKERLNNTYAGGGCSYGCMSDRILVQIRTSQPQQKEKFFLLVVSTAVIAMLVVLPSSSNSFSSSSSFPS
jgi:hypothetical protein